MCREEKVLFGNSHHSEQPKTCSDWDIQRSKSSTLNASLRAFEFSFAEWFFKHNLSLVLNRMFREATILFGTGHSEQPKTFSDGDVKRSISPAGFLNGLLSAVKVLF